MEVQRDVKIRLKIMTSALYIRQTGRHTPDWCLVPAAPLRPRSVDHTDHTDHTHFSDLFQFLTRIGVAGGPSHEYFIPPGILPIIYR